MVLFIEIEINIRDLYIHCFHSSELAMEAMHETDVFGLGITQAGKNLLLKTLDSSLVLGFNK
jgi:hypothetical protein